MPKHPALNGKVANEAERLHALGFAVVPCQGKRAIVNGWHEKTLTLAQLRKALSGTKLNIAIACTNQMSLMSSVTPQKQRPPCKRCSTDRFRQRQPIKAPEENIDYFGARKVCPKKQSWKSTASNFGLEMARGL